MGYASSIAKKLSSFFGREAEKSKDIDIASDKIQKLLQQIDGVYSQMRNMSNKYDDLGVQISNNLLLRYSDYEDMDEHPIGGRCYDIYADESTRNDVTTNKPIWAVSNDLKVVNICNDMMYNRLKYEDNYWEIARSCCKYGNDFNELLIAPSEIVGLRPFDAPAVRRYEDDFGRLEGFAYSETANFPSNSVFKEALAVRESGNVTQDIVYAGTDKFIPFESWEMIHFRLRSKHRTSKYGYSVLEPARYAFKRLVMLEDAVILHSLSKAPSRFAFYVSVPEHMYSQTEKAMAYVDKVRQQFRRKRIIDPRTNRLDLKVNPLSVVDDFWLPVFGSKGESVRIDTITGPEYEAIKPLEYFQMQFFAASGIPLSYLKESDTGTAKNSVSSENIMFASSVMRVQRMLRSGTKTMCDMDLFLHGIDPDKVDYDLKTTAPSAIFELAQLELWAARADIAERLRTYVSDHWVMTNIFDFTDEEIEGFREQLRGDAELRGELQGTESGVASQVAAEYEPEMPGFGAEPGAGNGAEEPVAASVISARNSRSTRSEYLKVKRLFDYLDKNINNKKVRDSERRLEDKFDKILKNDAMLSNKINGMKDSMTEVKMYIADKLKSKKAGG